MQLDGYNLIKSKHPSNEKRGGVSIFYKENTSIPTVYLLSFSE